MNMQEQLDNIIASLPERPIHKILITKLVSGMYKVEYNQKQYLLVNNILWIKLEQELDHLMTRLPTEHIIPENMFMTYWNIPVYEDEKLVKEIIQNFILSCSIFNREL